MSEPENLPKTPAETFALASSLPGDLAEKLSLYLKHSARLRPEFAAAYDRLISHLVVLSGGRIGPLAGEEMPSFLLPNQRGELISLDGMLATGPVVIVLNRGHWCPYCRLDLRALAKIEPDVRRLGAQIVSIMPEKAEFTKRAIADNALPFPVLTDVDLSYALSLGLIYWVGAEVKQLYDNIGIELETFQGNHNYFLPIAAKFIVGRDGLVKAREVDIDFRQRMQPAAILEALAQL